jgi:tRNA threonylcarbamoyladenosine biosynthesis protein TsaB
MDMIPTYRHEKQRGNLRLAIDCSTSCLTVALLEQEELLSQTQIMADRNHSVVLLPEIEKLFASQHRRTEQLDAIAVGIGPGSYTGVRIGVAVAKTLAWATQCHLVGVSSLAALSLGASRTWLTNRTMSHSQASSPSAVWVVPMMYARRGQVFTGLYRIEGQHVTTLIPDHIQNLDTWLEDVSQRYAQFQVDGNEQLRANRSLPSELLLATSPADMSAIATHLQGSSYHTLLQTHGYTHEIQAADIGVIAHAKLREGHVDNVHALVPHYAQLPEAEVNYIAKAQKGEDGDGN